MQVERETERTQQHAFDAHSFNQESIHSILTELLPLLHSHYSEIALYQDIQLKPEFDTYYKLEELGLLKIFTLRDSNKALCGYAAYIIRKAIHYTDSVQAHQDVLYINPDLRGKGLGHVFINYCDNELKRMGVQVVFQHVTRKHDYSSTLKGLGYELNEIVFSRRLDK
jgi:GNAT superfamily N-acetyltransferase